MVPTYASSSLFPLTVFAGEKSEPGSARAPSGALPGETCAKVCKQNLMFPKVRIAMTDAVEQQAAFSRKCALIAAKAADEKKATDIMVQEVRDLIGVTDYFVIATAANSPPGGRHHRRDRGQAARGGVHQAHPPRDVRRRKLVASGLRQHRRACVHARDPRVLPPEALWNDAPVIDLAAEAGLENLQYSDRIAKLLGREAAQATRLKAPRASDGRLGRRGSAQKGGARRAFQKERPSATAEGSFLARADRRGFAEVLSPDARADPGTVNNLAQIPAGDRQPSA